MATLTIREPGRVAVRVTASDGQMLGRDPACDVVLGHRTVSRRHARLARAADGMHIIDLGSTHGTQIDGRPVVDGLLRDGTAVYLGSVLVEYSAGEELSARDEEVTVYPPIAAGESPGPSPSAPAPGDERRRLEILFELGRAVGAHDDTEALVGRVIDAVLGAFRCERGVVELVSSGVARRVARGKGAGDLVVSRAVQAALVERRERVLILGKQTASAPSLVKQGVRAAMAVPLATVSGPMGFIYVDDRTRADRFTAAELDFLTAVAHLLAAAVEQARDRQRLLSLVEAERSDSGDLVGASEPMVRLRKEVKRYAAARDTAVLVRGESGTGKELVARTLHALSPRAAGPFVAVNCAAIPDTMIESELFGHERGAFTGAVKPHRGKFALAEGGTLFLDEVGDLSPGAQAKVLRALENGEVLPLGSERLIEVDVRIISATHKALEQEIAAGRFREDLFYRLAVGEIKVPPLRAREGDAVQLAEMFRERFAAQLAKRVTGFSAEAIETLRQYSWPGNVRQLRNEIERAVILADGELIEELSVTPTAEAASPPADPTLMATLDDAERRHVEAALRAHRGNILATARAIGVSRGLLYRKIARYGIKV